MWKSNGLTGSIGKAGEVTNRQEDIGIMDNKQITIIGVLRLCLKTPVCNRICDSKRYASWTDASFYEIQRRMSVARTIRRLLRLPLKKSIQQQTIQAKINNQDICAQRLYEFKEVKVCACGQLDVMVVATPII